MKHRFRFNIFLLGGVLLSCADGNHTADGDISTPVSVPDTERGGVSLLYSGFPEDTGSGQEIDTDTGTGAGTEPATDTATATDMATDTGTADRGSDTDTGTGGPSLSYILNPYSRAPLSAIVTLRHPDIAPDDIEWMRVTVAGIGKPSEDLVAELDPRSSQFKTNFDMSDQLAEGEVGIPILGLYPEAENLVGVEVRTATTEYSGSVVITTPRIAATQGEIVTVDIPAPERVEPGWVYVDRRVYDPFGNVRWIGPKVYYHLENGNYLSGVDERNWLGKNVRNRTLPSYLSFHHSSIQLPDGNVVACVKNDDNTVTDGEGVVIPSKYDYIVELDGDTEEVVNAWDLREFLDVDRYTVSFKESGSDWFHMNTLGYDASDDSIIVSGRYQGLVKLTRNGIQGDVANAGQELVWILAPHLDWGMSGWDGQGDIDPNDYLLLAVDSSGAPYDEDVQNNLAAPSDDLEPFFWSVGQHGISITGRGEGTVSFVTFNNQASFIFDGEGTTDNGVIGTVQGDLSNDRSTVPYSQIIEYEVDELAGTVRRLWSFGENQPELYGSFNSGAKALTVTGNLQMVSNGMDRRDAVNNPFNPHVVEVARDGEVVFHLQVENTTWSAHMGGKVDLYHPENH